MQRQSGRGTLPARMPCSSAAPDATDATLPKAKVPDAMRPARGEWPLLRWPGPGGRRRQIARAARWATATRPVARDLVVHHSVPAVPGSAPPQTTAAPRPVRRSAPRPTVRRPRRGPGRRRPRSDSPVPAPRQDPTQGAFNGQGRQACQPPPTGRVAPAPELRPHAAAVVRQRLGRAPQRSSTRRRVPRERGQRADACRRGRPELVWSRQWPGGVQRGQTGSCRPSTRRCGARSTMGRWPSPTHDGMIRPPTPNTGRRTTRGTSPHDPG
jgi:hypothetical protein